MCGLVCVLVCVWTCIVHACVYLGGGRCFIFRACLLEIMIMIDNDADDNYKEHSEFLLLG